MTSEALQTGPRGSFGNVLSRLAAPDDPSRLGRRGWVITWGIIVAILLPTLVLPLGSDEALYFVFGQKILQGGIPYRDLIDIKQPLIYYLYSVAVALFGNGAISIRILDLILQLLTCWLLIRIVKGAGGSDLTAALAPILYLMPYLGQGYGILALPESYMGLLGGGMIALLISRRTPSGFLAIGVLSAILLLLKFTLAIMLPAIMLCEWMLFDEPRRRRLLHVLQMACGFLVGPIALWIFLTTTGAMTGFLEVESFTTHYVRNEMVSLSQWMKNLSTLIPYHLAIDYSLMLMIGLGAGIGISVGIGGRWRRDTVRLLQICVISFVFLMFSIVVEAKYHTSHITRYYAICSILSSFGIVRLLYLMATGGFSPRRNGFHGLIALLIGMSLILYSPVAGYGWRTAAIGWKNIKRELGMSTSNVELVQDLPLVESRQIAQYINERRQPEDRIFVTASIAGLVCHTVGYVPDFRLLHSAFLTASFAPKSWTDGTRDYLLHRDPRFVVAQFNDSFPSITGSHTTAIVALRSLAGVDSLLRNNYTMVLRTASLELYERQRPSGYR